MDITKGEVMTGIKQQIEQEEFRAATAILIRAIILDAIVALVVSAAPAAAAGTPKASSAVQRAERATAFADRLSPVVTRKLSRGASASEQQRCSS